MKVAAGFVLCADDFAFTPAVSAGILQLLEAGRISATGAMTNRPGWQADAARLRAFAGRADLGLHLNLTAGESLGRMAGLAPAGTLPRMDEMIRASLARSLPRAEIAAEIERQLDAFEQVMGAPPDFVDGHQHVHGLHGVREPLLDVLARRYPQERPWLRDPGDRPAAIAARRRHVAKALMIAWFARGFGADASRKGFDTNSGFAGFSAFDPRADYDADFARYLIEPGRYHLVMCHPGRVDDDLRRLDRAVESRERELAFLLGPRFDDILAATGRRPARMREL